MENLNFDEEEEILSEGESEVVSDVASNDDDVQKWSDDQVVDIERAVATFAGKHGTFLKNAVVDFMLYADKHHVDVYPTEMLQYRDRAYKLSSAVNAKPSLGGIHIILEYCSMSVYHIDKYVPVERILYPGRTHVDYLTMEILSSISVHDTEFRQLTGVAGNNVIDYVVPKYDGFAIHHYVLSYGGITRGFYVLKNKLYFSDEVRPFSGELVGDEIYLQYGFDLKGSMQIDDSGRSCDFVVNTPLPLTSDVDVIKLPGTDGLIVCVNGTEYRVKYKNTIDLMYTSAHALHTSDRKFYNTGYKDGNVGMIYECEVDDVSRVFVIKERLDKERALSSLQVNSVLVAPTVYDFCRCMPDYVVYPRESIFVACQKTMLKLMRNYCRSSTDPKLSVTIVLALFKKWNVRCTIAFAKEVMHDLGIKGLSGTFEKSRFLGPDEAVYFATPHEIYTYMRRNKVKGSIQFIAFLIADGLKKLVKVSDMLEMSTSNILKCVGGGVSAVKEIDHWRLKTRISKSMLKKYLLGYAAYSTITNDEMALCDEVKELLEARNTSEKIGEITDVVILVAKILTAMNMTSIDCAYGDDVSTALWDSIFDIPIIAVGLCKYKERIMLSGCIRNHDREHDCQNMFRYIPN